MNLGSIGLRRGAALLGIGLLIVAACAPAAEEDGGEVTVIGAWGGDEQAAFLEMVAPWEEETGYTVNYTGTRDLNAVLTTGVASGVLPDLAGLPGPGQLVEFTEAGALQPLNEVLDLEAYRNETAPALVEIGTVNDQIMGVFIKAAVKGLIWYNPELHNWADSVPATWDELRTQAQANQGDAEAIWCMGVESGAASGWPGTDWIEDIVLRQAGPDVYNQWWQGEIAWTSPEIRGAFETFGEVVENTYGGADTIVTTNFEVAGDPLFENPPGCVFHHQASFITGLGAFAEREAGTGYDFFPFPDIDPQYAGAIEGAGDLFGMFNNTEASRSLMAYLVTGPAQAIWVGIGGALSANLTVDNYPDEISRRSAELIEQAETFAFDASDLMPTAMNAAFWTAIIDYVQNPGNLDQILADLDAVQADAYGGG